MGATGLVSQAVIPLSQVSEDLARLEAVFDACAPAFYRYAVVRVGDAHLAEDLVQQLWVQASSSSREVPAGELEFWLRGILANLVRSHWRASRRRPESPADPRVAAELAERIDRKDLPEAMIQRTEVRRQLLLALTELPSQQQELIVEHYFHDKPQTELARLQQVSERAIEGRLYRARQALKQTLEAMEADG